MKQKHSVQILEHLKRHRSITPMDALNLFGCYRLAARIYDLRDAGHEIVTDTSRGFATYRLETGK